MKRLRDLRRIISRQKKGRKRKKKIMRTREGKKKMRADQRACQRKKQNLTTAEKLLVGLGGEHVGSPGRNGGKVGTLGGRSRLGRKSRATLKKTGGGLGDEDDSQETYPLFCFFCGSRGKGEGTTTCGDRGGWGKTTGGARKRTQGKRGEGLKGKTATGWEAFA